MNGDCLIDERLDVRRRAGAGGSRHLAALREYDERWDGPDKRALAEIGKGLGVHLHDEDTAGPARRNFLELRRHHTAGTAPRRPLVDHDRD